MFNDGGKKDNMYNITPEMIEKLRALLEAKGIPASEDDNQLALLISQATTLIGDEYINGTPYSDYVKKAKKYIEALGGFEKFAEWGFFSWETQ